MLYANGARVVSISSHGLTRMMDVIVVAHDELGLTVSKKKTEAMYLWSDPNTASHAPRNKAVGQMNRRSGL